MAQSEIIDLILRGIVDKERRNQLAPSVREVKRIYSSVCSRCGQCCNRSDNMMLHEFEAPRIAHFLRERIGIGSVRSHLLCRDTSFNCFTRYMFTTHQSCPFVSGTECTIYPDRPMVCRLFPFFLKFFSDPIGTVPVQLPSFHIHCIFGAPCDAPTDDLLAALEEMGDFQFVGYYETLKETLGDRNSDLAFFFSRPLEDANSRRFINASRFQIPETGDSGALVSGVIASVYGEMVGVEVGPETALWKLGVRRLRGSEARQLTRFETWEKAERDSKHVVELAVSRIRDSCNQREPTD